MFIKTATIAHNFQHYHIIKLTLNEAIELSGFANNADTFLLPFQKAPIVDNHFASTISTVCEKILSAMERFPWQTTLLRAVEILSERIQIGQNKFRILR